MEFKEDLVKQFAAQLHNQHRRQWDARQKKKQRIADENRRSQSVNECHGDV
jgi:hypothetical protein